MENYFNRRKVIPKSSRFLFEMEIVILLSPLALSLSARAASTINTTNAYAWDANIGWTNWRPSAANGGSIDEYIC
jgi:hypothetical protein